MLYYVYCILTTDCQTGKYHMVSNFKFERLIYEKCILFVKSKFNLKLIFN